MMKVYVIGVGMGNPDTLTVGAKRAIEESELLIGAKRLLEPFADLACEKRELVKPDDIAEALANASGKVAFAQASVLMSGDVGFYSGAAGLYDKLDKLSGIDVEVIPGISSLVYFCAKLHTPWQDVALVSAHGREHDAAGAIQSHEKTFCITGGATKVEDICASLVERGLGDVRIVAGERLSYEDERIVEGTAAELAGMSFENLSVMLAFNEHPVVRKFGAPSLADCEFQRSEPASEDGKASKSVPMTKEEVRAVVIAKLRIAADSTVWDVGAGTGSVSIEAALAAPRGRVFAIEKNPDAIELLKHNRDAFGAINMAVVEGAAPEALAGLPAPERVFVGGSSGNMGAIVEAALTANPQVRLCATAVTLETLAELLACLRERGVEGADIVQMSVARADEVGSYHLMRAENPVYVVTVDFGGEGD